ncbi:hypothetical protein ACHAWF_012085 [Thalassiosira exigua]
MGSEYHTQRQHSRSRPPALPRRRAATKGVTIFDDDPSSHRHSLTYTLYLTMFSAKPLILAAILASASAFVPSQPTIARSTALSVASVEESVRDIVKSQLNPDGDFEDSASFMDDLGADSLDAVESLEEEFDIEIPEEEVESISTVQAAIDFVKKSQS